MPSEQIRAQTKGAWHLAGISDLAGRLAGNGKQPWPCSFSGHPTLRPSSSLLKPSGICSVLFCFTVTPALICILQPQNVPSDLQRKQSWAFCFWNLQHTIAPPLLSKRHQHDHFLPRSCCVIPPQIIIEYMRRHAYVYQYSRTNTAFIIKLVLRYYELLRASNNKAPRPHCSARQCALCTEWRAPAKPLASKNAFHLPRCPVSDHVWPIIEDARIQRQNASSNCYFWERVLAWAWCSCSQPSTLNGHAAYEGS